MTSPAVPQPTPAALAALDEPADWICMHCGTDYQGPHCPFCQSDQTMPGGWIDGKVVSLLCVSCGAKFSPAAQPEKNDAE